MSTLTTFHLFPTLPVEIRLKIWSFALAVPRTVTISCDRKAIIRGGPRTAKSWAADTTSPALLHVNRESRYEALAVYVPYFTTPSSPRPIYISLLQDTVKFADGVLPYVPRPPLLEIQKMILHTKDSAYFGFYNMEILKSMKGLRELYIHMERGVIPTWADTDGHHTLLMRNFAETTEADPGWECPKVWIFDIGTGNEMAFIEGGALIPGWEPPEKTPYVFEEDDDLMLDGDI